MKQRHKHQFNQVAVEKPAMQKQSGMMYILEQQKLRARQDLLKLRLATDSAENPQKYDREMLHNIYREIIKDPTLSSQWESRKMETKQRDFKVVNTAGEDQPEFTKILKADWFYEWIDAAMDSKQWGFTLIEFGPWNGKEFVAYEVGKKIYDPINVLIRDNIKPEFGIIAYTPYSIDGVKFTDPRLTDQLMFIGSHCSLGWLEKAAKYVLFKDNALGNWSEWAEVFGMDTRIGKTDADGDDRKRFVQAVRDLGTNAYAVFGTRDEIEFAGTSRTDAFGVYEHLIDKIDSQISKLIFGQDVVSNNTGHVVGKVGENVANKYGKADAMFIAHLINKKLFPFMENLGFSWKGLEFKWDTNEKVTLVDRAEVDLKVSKMGYRPDQKYIEDTYNMTVEVVETPKPMPNENQL